MPKHSKLKLSIEGDEEFVRESLSQVMWLYEQHLERDESVATYIGHYTKKGWETENMLSIGARNIKKRKQKDKKTKTKKN